MEFYFTTTATEGEHSFIEHDYIRPYCTRFKGVEVVYYRKFKTGHVPMNRECKISGFNGRTFSMFKKWAKDNGIELENYWKTEAYLETIKFETK